MKLLSRVYNQTNYDNTSIQTGYSVNMMNDTVKEPFFKSAIKVSYKILTHVDTLKKSPRYIQLPIPFSDYFQVILLLFIHFFSYFDLSNYISRF